MSEFCSEKNNENRSNFAEVIVKITVVYFMKNGYWIASGTVGDFYRATPYVSAVFAVAPCPSVRPSRSCIVSRRLKISSNFFLDPVAPSF